MEGWSFMFEGELHELMVYLLVDGAIFIPSDLWTLKEHFT